ncbi:MAG TPA: hypothetical protein DEA08_36855 [Planctomycetes bacterium]|nr:hypothetical protein [Planctomycetota bacterium]
MRAAALALIGVLLAPALAGAQEEARPAPKRSFKLNKHETPARVRFSVKNLEPFPITVTIEIKQLENLKPDQALPVSRVIPPGRNLRVLVLKRIDPERAWAYGDARAWHQIGSIAAKHDPKAVYRLPFPADQAIRVSQGALGKASHQGKHAYDFAIPAGQPILACRAGRVVQVVQRFKKGGDDKALETKGNRVAVLHADGSFGIYGHLQHEGALVELGQEVKAGEPIGRCGATGYAKAPHLHFEVRLAQRGRRDAATIPVRFATKRGVVELQGRERYRHPLEPRPRD